MKNKEQLQIVFISYVVGIGLSFIITSLKELDFEYYGMIGAVKVSTLLTFWWYFYFNFGWRIPIFNKMLYKINLNGTWYGTYESASSDTEEINTGNMVIRIKQNFLNVSVYSYTEKYKNFSHSEELKYDDKSDTNGLIYVYSQKENDPMDLASRNGTAELQIVKNKDTYKLSGEFWTIMGTKGRLNLVRVSKKIVDSFESGYELYQEYEQSKRR